MVAKIATGELVEEEGHRVNREDQKWQGWRKGASRTYDSESDLMFGQVHPTDGGTWFSYLGEGYPLTAYAALPGRSQVAVFWKGRAEVSRLSGFFVAAAGKILRDQPLEFTTWILTKEGRRHTTSLDSPLFPPRFQTDAQLVRFECRPKLPDAADVEPFFMAWARLDEPNPEDGVGVSLEPKDLPELHMEIAELVRDTADRDAKVDIGVVTSKLEHIRADINEASKTNQTKAS